MNIKNNEQFFNELFDLNAKPNVFIIAELSANHGGSIETAIETIKAAKRAGADAIKLQTYTANGITLNAPQDDFVVKGGTLWDGRSLYELYLEAETPWEWHEKLFQTAKDEGLICFSSPFDLEAVDFLETLNVPAYKIASFEITDIGLIEYVASKGKPIIISTGIAELEDINLALDACKRQGNDKIALLKCTSSYPAPLEEANLSMIKDIRERFKLISGLSDHTMGIIAPVIAVAMGARIIEKHFILDHNIGGPDASFSLDEREFTEMVKTVRECEAAIGEIDYSLTKKQLSGRNFCRSLYVSKDVKAGDVITINNVKSVRPGHGLHPKYLNQILGKKFNSDINAGERMSLLLCS